MGQHVPVAYLGIRGNSGKVRSQLDIPRLDPLSRGGGARKKQGTRQLNCTQKSQCNSVLQRQQHCSPALCPYHLMVEQVKWAKIQKHSILLKAGTSTHTLSQGGAKPWGDCTKFETWPSRPTGPRLLTGHSARGTGTAARYGHTLTYPRRDPLSRGGALEKSRVQVSWAVPRSRNAIVHYKGSSIAAQHSAHTISWWSKWNGPWHKSGTGTLRRLHKSWSLA